MENIYFWIQKSLILFTIDYNRRFIADIYIGKIWDILVTQDDAPSRRLESFALRWLAVK